MHRLPTSQWPSEADAEPFQPLNPAGNAEPAVMNLPHTWTPQGPIIDTESAELVFDRAALPPAAGQSHSRLAVNPEAGHPLLAAAGQALRAAAALAKSALARFTTSASKPSLTAREFGSLPALRSAASPGVMPSVSTLQVA